MVNIKELKMISEVDRVKVLMNLKVVDMKSILKNENIKKIYKMKKNELQEVMLELLYSEQLEMDLTPAVPEDQIFKNQCEDILKAVEKYKAEADEELIEEDIYFIAGNISGDLCAKYFRKNYSNIIEGRFIEFKVKVQDVVNVSDNMLLNEIIKLAIDDIEMKIKNEKEREVNKEEVIENAIQETSIVYEEDQEFLNECLDEEYDPEESFNYNEETQIYNSDFNEEYEAEGTIVITEEDIKIFKDQCEYMNEKIQECKKNEEDEEDYEENAFNISIDVANELIGKFFIKKDYSLDAAAFEKFKNNISVLVRSIEDQALINVIKLIIKHIERRVNEDIKRNSLDSMTPEERYRWFNPTNDDCPF